MVKIRYAELPAGLHVATEADERCTIVYLKPGLTTAQRKDALTVARRSARFGHGPSLPTLDMAFALAADRTRTATRIFTAVMRKHPLLLLPLVALVAGIIAAGVLASGAMVITAPPHLRSAQSGDLTQFNRSQLGSPGPSPSPAPSHAAPSPGPPGPASGRSERTASHRESMDHGRERDRNHPAAGLAPQPWARQVRPTVPRGAG
jgi:hypothetical protein